MTRSRFAFLPPALAVALVATVAVAEPPPALCSEAGICWEHPRPQGNALLALWAASERDVWVAGSAGTLLHFEGAGFARVNSGTSVSLRALWGSSATDLWVAGDVGTLLRYDGHEVRGVAIPTRAGLRALWGTSAGDVWAAGERGALLHYDGTRWAEVRSGGRETLLGLGGTGAGDVWAVGAGGVVLHFDGKTWTREKSGTVNALHAVWTASSSDVWAISGNGPHLHFDGKEWRPVPRDGASRRLDLFGAVRLPRRSAADVDSAPPAAVLAMDWCGRLYRGTGSDRTELTTALSLALLPAPKADHDALVGLPSSIFGLAPRGCEAGDVPPVIRAIASSAGVSFAAGDAGALWGLDSAGSWKRLESPVKASVRSLTLAGPREAWAAAGSSLLRWDGTSWAVLQPGLGGLSVESVWARGSSELWAAGASGKVLRRGTNGTMVEVRSGTSLPLASIWGASQGPIFFVGGEERLGAREPPGIILAWDGRRLARAATAPAPLAAVAGSGPRDVWAAGARGMLLQFDGKRWSPSRSGTTEDLTALWVGSSSEAWAAGKSGTLLRFDGSSWQRIDTGTRNHLYAIAGDAEIVRVAGVNATILAVPRSRPR